MHISTNSSLLQGQRDSGLQPHLTVHVPKLVTPSFKFCLENSYSSYKTPGEMPPSSEMFHRVALRTKEEHTRVSTQAG